eukprot:2973652-Amphidinium_carterae.1
MEDTEPSHEVYFGEDPTDQEDPFRTLSDLHGWVLLLSSGQTPASRVSFGCSFVSMVQVRAAARRSGLLISIY